ncbi:hypothetical protein [Hymenobacter armeniacus]|uniref:Carboxypeptidase regulatory-like domain-containing protein n=1 Tax=Hymenobacter armeniacus TaxID=2771358 RepID=A0ABR8JYT2_9BACT|nr:hypothetical protein [Hymenobacter armeniacus]MBD2724183.1 hypothetical protein [Hymenobacter armeniacus]
MKYFFLVFTLLYSTIALCQVQITGTIMDKETGKSMPGLYLYVHKDYDKWIDINQTDAQGNFVGIIKADELSSKSKYQIFINEKGYEQINYEVDINNHEPVTIQLIRRKPGPLIWDCGTPSFGFYAPQVSNSLSDLPDFIQKKLAAYLIDRLGSDYYSRTQFSGGRVVDINRLHNVEPNSLNYQWTVHNYYLCFAIADTLGGSMAMDSTGRVTVELGFPAIGHDASKAKVITKNEAIKIAKRNKSYKRRKTTIAFGYDNKNDCFQWTFRNCTYKGVNVGCNILHIAAHTGQVLRTSRTAGKRSFYR